MRRFDDLFPNEFKSYIQTHHEFAKKLDAKTVTVFANGVSLQDVRDIYISKTLGDLIQKMVLEEVSANNQSHDELINVSRMIIKWCARQRMWELGFTDALEDIHRDNLQKYGNAIGPTPAFLKQKYQHDSRAVANAAKRFRSSDDIHHRFKF